MLEHPHVMTQESWQVIAARAVSPGRVADRLTAQALFVGEAARIEHVADGMIAYGTMTLPGTPPVPPRSQR